MFDQNDLHAVRAPRIYDDITQTIGHTPLGSPEPDAG